MPLGRMFFQEPSDECLRQVIFEPANVKQKAWVVFINYMLLAMVSTEPAGANEAKHFRSNMRLALNDASLFLTPSIVSVQTLAILAIHGEDFAAPSQSWMLVGHACRQAEALALHAPAHVDSEKQQQRLCLFWLLFIIDKGCSMAFGRSPSLRTSDYYDTPLPDRAFIAKNCPRMETSESNDQARPSQFGVVFYLKGFELTKLVGDLLETGRESGHRQHKDKLRDQLDEWWRSTNAVSTSFESTWYRYSHFSRSYPAPSRMRATQQLRRNSTR